MFLYLIQHAEAMREEDDPSRSLTEKGIADIKKVAECAAKLDLKADLICHSGKMRAMQTAQILTDYLKFGKPLTYTDGLAPMDDVQIWINRLARMDEDVMLVGHLPHLGSLSAALLCGDKDKNLIDFKMGCVVCLKRFEDGKWAVEWMITPEMIK
ncbi:MAG: phosphohistidine phosphatase SixA [Nitrospirae bacterium]|nr:phosphohistidine phosphatase SixA [Nitrospirota bacterium]